MAQVVGWYLEAIGLLKIAQFTGAEQVKVLDGLVRYRFGNDAELMGAWAGARNVLGPFKPKGEPGAGNGQTPRAA